MEIITLLVIVICTIIIFQQMHGLRKEIKAWQELMPYKKRKATRSLKKELIRDILNKDDFRYEIGNEDFEKAVKKLYPYSGKVLSVEDKGDYLTVKIENPIDSQSSYAVEVSKKDIKKVLDKEPE